MAILEKLVHDMVGYDSLLIYFFGQAVDFGVRDFIININI